MLETNTTEPEIKLKHLRISTKIISALITIIIITNIVTLPTNIKFTSDLVSQLSNVEFELEEIENDYSNLSNGTLIAINSSFSNFEKLLEKNLNQKKENETKLEERIFNLIFKKYYLNSNRTVSVVSNS